MKKTTILIISLMVLLSIALIGTATAQNMTVSDLGLLGPQTLLLYNASTGALLGTYNTSVNGLILPTTDFIIILKPETTNVFSNPTAFLTAGFNFVSTYGIELIVIGFVIGLIFWRR